MSLVIPFWLTELMECFHGTPNQEAAAPLLAEGYPATNKYLSTAKFATSSLEVALAELRSLAVEPLTPAIISEVTALHSGLQALVLTAPVEPARAAANWAAFLQLAPSSCGRLAEIRQAIMPTPVERRGLFVRADIVEYLKCTYLDQAIAKLDALRAQAIEHRQKVRALDSDALYRDQERAHAMSETVIIYSDHLDLAIGHQQVLVDAASHALTTPYLESEWPALRAQLAWPGVTYTILDPATQGKVASLRKITCRQSFKKWARQDHDEELLQDDVEAIYLQAHHLFRKTYWNSRALVLSNLRRLLLATPEPWKCKDADGASAAALLRLLLSRLILIVHHPQASASPDPAAVQAYINQEASLVRGE